MKDEQVGATDSMKDEQVGYGGGMDEEQVGSTARADRRKHWWLIIITVVVLLLLALVAALASMPSPLNTYRMEVGFSDPAKFSAAQLQAAREQVVKDLTIRGCHIDHLFYNEEVSNYSINRELTDPDGYNKYAHYPTAKPDQMMLISAHLTCNLLAGSAQPHGTSVQSDYLLCERQCTVWKSVGIDNIDDITHLQPWWTRLLTSI
ncbi:hypothetical protein KIM372_14620 [Bombiscardovia nodaiensis]|uniref:Uncharacterized protein n=1 Tax=Bombiscardovia nodaiensis TaxID=2932181 RepID=A0ABN6SG82_9BIFI|nr:hypothetical protein KIM372_14620 [Bombiscardovia nodaiensis]